MTLLLAHILKENILFLGVGNPMKGDDGVGPYIAKRIGGIDVGTVPENFVSRINASEEDTIVVFDALEFGGVPGDVRIVDANESEGVTFSTHSLPLSKFSKFLELKTVWLVGIQPSVVEFAEGMSPDVTKSADLIVEEISRWLGTNR
ncbi:MAG: hydrogenase 3 maturation endopeptidase HyCI [Candidatus Micrarchaeota archaeon]